MGVAVTRSSHNTERRKHRDVTQPRVYRANIQLQFAYGLTPLLCLPILRKFPRSQYEMIRIKILISSSVLCKYNIEIICLI